MDRMEADTGVDIFKLMAVAEEKIIPIMDHLVRVDRDSLVLGYAGVYSSFLLFAKRAGAKYGVPSQDILLEMAKRKAIGGQEDLIEDVAMQLAKAQGNIKAG